MIIFGSGNTEKQLIKQTKFATFPPMLPSSFWPKQWRTAVT